MDAVETFVLEGIGVYHPLYKLLEKYPNRKIILTNADDAQLIEFGLIDLPYELFSLKHNPNKEDSGYYKQMM